MEGYTEEQPIETMPVQEEHVANPTIQRRHNVLRALFAGLATISAVGVVMLSQGHAQQGEVVLGEDETISAANKFDGCGFTAAEGHLVYSSRVDMDTPDYGSVTHTGNPGEGITAVPANGACQIFETEYEPGSNGEDTLWQNQEYWKRN